MPISRSKNSFPFLPWLLAGCLFFVMTGPALATWSIVVANTETGEVAIGSATCVNNTNLKQVVGVIVVGMGAGQAQASSDGTGQNRQTIADSLLAGMTAEEVLELLKVTDPSLHTHQYGIVDLRGGAATFTGDKTWDYTSGLTGKSGPMVYAIQGNVLTGEGVIIEAEKALIQTPGDLATKLMAAMEAAKVYGGDGRCSCKDWDPTGCGCPPIAGWKKDKSRKTAHIGYMVIARIGDQDGIFSPPTGFANGSYYMDLNVIKTTKVDPVDSLEFLLAEFRSSWAGHTDHLLTQKTIYPEKIPARPKAGAELLIAPFDINDHRISLALGIDLITVTHDEESAGLTTIGPVVNCGDGTYSVALTSPTGPGTDIFRVVIDDGKGPVTLYPFPTLEVD